MANSAHLTISNIRTRPESAFAPLSPRSKSLDEALVAKDFEIVAAAQAGSQTAFEELLRRYSPRLYRTILRITKNREDAEDVLQETFLRVYVALHSFEARSSVYSWLTRIAINSSLMILRRRRTRPEASLLVPFERAEEYAQLEIRDMAPNQEELCELGQQKENLLRAIENLAPVLRAPIEIQLRGEHSMKEIATILDASVAAVKARLHRARAHLARRVSVHRQAKTTTQGRQTGRRMPA